MASEHKKQYIAGAVLILAVAAFILVVFSLLSRTDKEELSLADTGDRRCGWRYELLMDGRAQAYEPTFTDKGYTALPEGTEAVRITRAMTEDIPEAELVWISLRQGVEVFLDGELLFSDFRLARRDADGFLRLTQEDRDRFSQAQGDSARCVRVSLPADYLGGELSMITYPSGDGGVLAAGVSDPQQF